MTGAWLAAQPRVGNRFLSRSEHHELAQREARRGLLAWC